MDFFWAVEQGTMCEDKQATHSDLGHRVGDPHCVDGAVRDSRRSNAGCPRTEARTCIDDHPDPWIRVCQCHGQTLETSVAVPI
jgi:hypothetical protein